MNQSKNNEGFIWLEIFNRYDPVGLISVGAPIGEYEDEIGMVERKCADCKSEDELRMLVWEVFTKCFGSDSPVKERCDQLASELWSQLHSLSND